MTKHTNSPTMVYKNWFSQIFSKQYSIVNIRFIEVLSDFENFWPTSLIVRIDQSYI